MWIVGRNYFSDAKSKSAMDSYTSIYLDEGFAFPVSNCFLEPCYLRTIVPDLAVLD